MAAKGSADHGDRNAWQEAKLTVGCSVILAVPGFVLGLIGSLFADDVSVGQRLMGGGMMAGITFVASVLLFMSDRSRYRDARNGARDMMLTERDMPDAKFCLDFPDIDPKLVCQIRSAIAEFFDTPPEKLHPTYFLSKDDVEALGPSLHSFVVERVAQIREAQIEGFKFTAAEMYIADFVRDVAILFD